MSSDPVIYGAAWGQQLTVDNSRDGYVDDGNIAWEERIAQARSQWPQASPEDFEKVGKRRWIDRATGIEYRQEPGAPLLTIGTDANRAISLFLVADGKLVFLSRADIPQGTYVRHGEFYGAQVIDGRIVKERSA
jgi:hypothetical protein